MKSFRAVTLLVATLLFALLVSVQASLTATGRQSQHSLSQNMFDENKLVSSLERMSRQLPSIWKSLTSFSSNSGLSRQMFDMLDIVTDVAMLTFLGIPILGLVALAGTALGPLVGSAASAGRKRRDATGPAEPHAGFVDRAGKALLYARNLYDVLANLEEAFLSYDIKSDDCQHKVICEVHKVGRNSDYKDFGNKILDLFRMEKELEDQELVPLSRLIFASYADSARRGLAQEECATIYSNCPTDLIEFISAKQLNQRSSEAPQKLD